MTGSAAEPAFGALPTRPMERALRADGERIERLTGWRARTGLEEGLRRVVEASASATGAETSPRTAEGNEQTLA